MPKLVLSDGISFEKEISNFQAGQIVAFVSSDLPTSPITPAARSTVSQDQALISSPSTFGSPREALNDSNATTNPEKITVFASYLSSQRGQSEFSSAELKDMFKRVGEPTPKNFGRDMREVIRLGYMFEEAGRYFVTERGQEIVSNQFNDGKKSGIRKRKSNSTTGRTGGKKSLREEVASLEISADLEEFPGYHSIKVKGQRILWLLAFGDKNSLTYLSSSEIEFLANRLRDSIPTRALTALNTTNVKNGWVAQTSEGYRILQKGLEFLKNTGNV